MLTRKHIDQETAYQEKNCFRTNAEQQILVRKKLIRKNAKQENADHENDDQENTDQENANQKMLIKTSTDENNSDRGKR